MHTICNWIDKFKFEEKIPNIICRSHEIFLVRFIYHLDFVKYSSPPLFLTHFQFPPRWIRMDLLTNIPTKIKNCGKIPIFMLYQLQYVINSQIHFKDNKIIKKIHFEPLKFIITFRIARDYAINCLNTDPLVKDKRVRISCTKYIILRYTVERTCKLTYRVAFNVEVNFFNKMSINRMSMSENTRSKFMKSLNRRRRSWIAGSS